MTEAGADIDKSEVEKDLGEVPYPQDNPFSEKSKFLYDLLINKLSTDLHDRIISIEGKSGFEVYWQVAQILDAVPEHAPFIMNAELLQLATLQGLKVRDRRSLYGFRLLLMKKNAEFKKVVGKQPDDHQSRLILWNVLDPESKCIGGNVPLSICLNGNSTDVFDW